MSHHVVTVLSAQQDFAALPQIKKKPKYQFCCQAKIETREVKCRHLIVEASLRKFIWQVHVKI